MDKLLKCSCGNEGVWSGNLRLLPLLYAGDALLLASLAMTFSLHWRFATAARKLAKSEAMFLKILGVLFKSVGRMEQEGRSTHHGFIHSNEGVAPVCCGEEEF